MVVALPQPPGRHQKSQTSKRSRSDSGLGRTSRLSQTYTSLSWRQTSSASSTYEPQGMISSPRGDFMLFYAVEPQTVSF